MKAVPVAVVARSPMLLTGAVLLLLALVGAVTVALHWTVERPLNRRLRGLVGHRASVVGREEQRLASTPGLDAP